MRLELFSISRRGLQVVRFSKCPQCSNKTGQRKLPLFVHIEPKQPLLLNKTCRYCPHCDLLIAHKDELDAVIRPRVRALLR